MKRNRSRIKIGCCGFPKAKKEYYRRFRLVEVQQTFYQPPLLKTAETWRAGAPEGFEFAVKAWQLITHPASSPTYRRLRTRVENPGRCGFFKPTDEVWAAWERTKEIALALRARIVLFQCPAGFAPTEAHVRDLRGFFSRLRRPGREFLFAWEPRGGWDDGLIRDLCRDLGLIHCVDPFVRPPVFGDLAYFRLHGIGGYGYRFTEDDLRKVLLWCQEHPEVYLLFNNVSMFDDALRMKGLANE